MRALLLVSNLGFGEQMSPGCFSVMKGSHTEASPFEKLDCHMKKSALKWAWSTEVVLGHCTYDVLGARRLTEIHRRRSSIVTVAGRSFRYLLAWVTCDCLVVAKSSRFQICDAHE